MGHKATFYWACIKYAWHGSIDGANAAASIPGAVILYVAHFFWTGEKMIPPETVLGGIELLAAGLGVAWVMIFVIRLCTAPAHFYSKQQELIKELTGQLNVINKNNTAILRLTQLRSEGVKIRNDSVSIASTTALDAWGLQVANWMTDVIAAIKPISKAEAEHFEVIGEVPPPRVPIQNVSLGEGNDRRMLIATFCQHDARLAKLDVLLKKNGIG